MQDFYWKNLLICMYDYAWDYQIWGVNKLRFSSLNTKLWWNYRYSINDKIHIWTCYLDLIWIILFKNNAGINVVFF